jgi:hypothetical protein
VANVETATLTHRFGPGRLGFLFVGSGQAAVTAADAGGQAHAAELASGDAIRLADIATIAVSGNAELVFWDIPRI